MLIYYILTIETVWVAIIAAVSALNLDSPRDTGLNLSSIALSISTLFLNENLFLVFAGFS